MDAGTPRLWRRRTIAAIGTFGIALTGSGVLFPGIASASVDTDLSWTLQNTTSGGSSYVVPKGVCAIDWTVQGGSGGTGGDAGGSGGLVVSRMSGLHENDEFHIRLGGAGKARSEGGAGGLSLSFNPRRAGGRRLA
jgi:hypothetical protein